VQQYESQLKSDDLIAHHLDLLYDKMLEANLLKIIHPYRYHSDGRIRMLWCC
jgi:hypothetical protein